MIKHIVVAVLAAVAGFALYKYVLAPQRAAAPAAAPSTAPLPATIAEDGTAPAMLPEFTLADRTGEPRSIKSWPEKSLIINFWATWCEPCRREIPLLNQIQAQHAAEGFQVIGVAIDFREDVLKYAEEVGITYPLLIGEQDGVAAMSKFGLSAGALPLTVFTDRNERIVLTHLGEITRDESIVFLEAVRNVNEGRHTVAEARAVAAKQLADLQQQRS